MSTLLTEVEAKAVTSTTLLERTDGGIKVSLTWDPEDKLLLLHVSDGQQIQVVCIPPGDARRAFDHPACFVPSPEKLWHR
jgi:hypothetical protein